MASSPSPSYLLSLPHELHLRTFDFLPFWGVYALRLTNRHFATITPPLPSLVDTNNLLVECIDKNPIGGEDEFNRSWLAITSNRSFSECCWFHDSWYERLEDKDGAVTVVKKEIHRKEAERYLHGCSAPAGPRAVFGSPTIARMIDILKRADSSS